MNISYPVNLHLRGCKVIVIGGGPIAERKVLGLLDTGAVVELISPRLTENLAAMAGKGQFYHLQRKYEQGDLVGASLVICACGDAAVNMSVVAEAGRERIYCNIVDEPELCSFTAPAVLRRGLLSIAISTNGACPALAKELRRRLEEFYGPEYETLLEKLQAIREQLRRQYPNDEKKRKIEIEKAVKALLAKLIENS